MIVRNGIELRVRSLVYDDGHRQVFESFRNDRVVLLDCDHDAGVFGHMNRLLRIMKRTKEQLARQVVDAVVEEIMAREDLADFWVTLEPEERGQVKDAWAERIWRIV